MGFSAFILLIQLTGVEPIFADRDPIAERTANPECEETLAVKAPPSAVVRDQQAIPLAPNEWQQIYKLFAQSQFVAQNRGDIADHRLDVTMFVTNPPGKVPFVSNPQGQALLHILASAKMLRFYNQLIESLGGDSSSQQLYVRRMQGNSMTQADYNHAHRDDDDDPDYTFAVLIYLTDPNDYSGGELIVEGYPAPIEPKQFSMAAFRGHVIHEVADVQAAAGKKRDSIVVLFGRHNGPNRRAE